MTSKALATAKGSEFGDGKTNNRLLKIIPSKEKMISTYYGTSNAMIYDI